jgi:hypothetical protein
VADPDPVGISVRPEIVPRTFIPRFVMDNGTRLGTVAVLHISAEEETPGTSVGPTSQRITGQLPAPVGTALVRQEARPRGFTAERVSLVHIRAARLSVTRLSRDLISTTLPPDRFRVDDSHRPQMARTSIPIAALTEP